MTKSFICLWFVFSFAFCFFAGFAFFCFLFSLVEEWELQAHEHRRKPWRDCGSISRNRSQKPPQTLAGLRLDFSPSLAETAATSTKLAARFLAIARRHRRKPWRACGSNRVAKGS